MMTGFFGDLPDKYDLEGFQSRDRKEELEKIRSLLNSIL
jgi:hypothetical protein